MALTSGFFNSIGGDRRYNAEQMASIFDGVIHDGVYQSIGSAFAVTASGGLSLTVGTGRAWFKHTWTLLDAPMILTADPAEVVSNRYDAVILEVNTTEVQRANTIKIIKGVPGTTPTYPALTKTATANQYPLAYIYRAGGSSSISQANVAYMVGTTECPYVLGIATSITTDAFTAQWSAQWEAWFAAKSGDSVNEIDVWIAQQQAEFDAWFAAITTVIETNTATQLANRLLTLETAWNELALTQTIYRGLESSTGAVITDSALAPITAKIVYQVAK